MDKLKCPICYIEVEERNFKETYVSPYNDQEHKCYEYLNCEVLEHQDKPREFLGMVKGLLREGGCIWE
jgi:2-polyprenyl-3-methyl-5-hydroxy-6-metoxy-1,4-benzoquinol methylase